MTFRFAFFVACAVFFPVTQDSQDKVLFPQPIPNSHTLKSLPHPFPIQQPKRIRYRITLLYTPTDIIHSLHTIELWRQYTEFRQVIHAVLTLKYSLESCANANSIDIDLGLCSLQQKHKNSRTQIP